MGPGRASGAEPEGVFQNVESSPRRPAPHARLALVGFVGLCLLVGLVDVLSMPREAVWYGVEPPLWLAPAAGLYPMIGVSAWLVWRRAGYARRRHYQALRLWGWQLLASALWPPLFFQMHAIRAALLVMIALACLVVATVRGFARIHAVAAWLLIPYLFWIAYAGYYNAASVVLS